MLTSTRVSLTCRIVLCLLALACLAPISNAVAAGTEGAIKYQPESFSQYQRQLADGQVKAVTINKRVRSLRLTLKDETHVLARYKPHEEPKVAAALQAKGVAVSVLQPSEAAKKVKKAPAHHKLRYIAAGILIVVVIVVGLVLYVDRKRKLERAA